MKKLVSLATFKLKTIHNATGVLPLYLFVGWFDSRHEHPVAIDELHEGVADGISCTADPNGLHHTRVPQLTHTELPVKQLQTHTRQPSLKFLFRSRYILQSQVIPQEFKMGFDHLLKWSLKNRVLHDAGETIKGPCFKLIPLKVQIWPVGDSFFTFRFY